MTRQTEPRRTTNPQRPRLCRVGSLAGCTALVIVTVCALTRDVRSQDPDTRDVILDTRSAMERWVENERQISKERSDWKMGREILQEQIDLLQQEISSLRGSIAEAEKKAEEYEDEHTKLKKKSERLKEAASQLAELLGDLEQRTKLLLQRSPRPVTDQVEQLSQQIPKDPNKTEMSLSRRFQNVVGILNEVNKFNGEIEMSTELRELPGADGNSAQVTAVYLGIGQSYYVTGNGRVAALGTATEDDWQWTPVNDAANSIQQLIAILKNEQVASFVHLPINIHNGPNR